MKIFRIQMVMGSLALLFVILLAGCSSSAPSGATTAGVKRVPAGKEFSGFLTNYSVLKPNAEIDGETLTFVRADAQANLHKYIAVIVEPVQVYLASGVDESKVPEKARTAAASYFHNALVSAVSSAFPVVEQPGPLVLRLRSAIVGVDAGSNVAAGDKPQNADDALDQTVKLEGVTLEMELVDSVTGEQIAAVVDREHLGAGAEIGAVNFSKRERGQAAREAFDGWARRLRRFLDSAHELSPEDAKRADQSYRPYEGDATK